MAALVAAAAAAGATNSPTRSAPSVPPPRPSTSSPASSSASLYFVRACPCVLPRCLRATTPRRRHGAGAVRRSRSEIKDGQRSDDDRSSSSGSIHVPLRAGAGTVVATPPPVAPHTLTLRIPVRPNLPLPPGACASHPGQTIPCLCSLNPLVSLLLSLQSLRPHQRAPLRRRRHRCHRAPPLWSPPRTAQRGAHT